MDLWIRSQDKKNLLKIDNVMIDKIDECVYKKETLTDCYSVATYIFDKLYYLGIYRSEKKALGVISKIQSLLQPRIYVNRTIEPKDNVFISISKDDSKYECRNIQFDSIVYEMPEDK